MFKLAALNSIPAGLGLISHCVLLGNLLYVMLGILTKLSTSPCPVFVFLLYWLQSIFLLCLSFLASLCVCNLCYFDHKLDGLPRLFDIPQDMAESQNEARAKAEAEAYFIFPNDSAQNVSKERGGDREAKVEPKKGKTEPKPNPQTETEAGKSAHKMRNLCLAFLCFYSNRT